MIMYSMQENKSLYFIVNVTMIIITIVERLRIGRECNKTFKLAHAAAALQRLSSSAEFCLFLDNFAFRVSLFELHN